MKEAIRIEAVTTGSQDLYIEVGRSSYLQHYAHLWKHQDPSVYLDKNFTRKTLICETKASNSYFFIIYEGPLAIGILKIQKNAALAPYNAHEAMLLDKIYILNQFAGKGIGNQVLNFVVDFGKTNNKKLIWLEAMQKGAALQFYLKYGFSIYTEIEHPAPQVLTVHKAMYTMMLPLQAL